MKQVFRVFRLDKTDEMLESYTISPASERFDTEDLAKDAMEKIEEPGEYVVQEVFIITK